MGNILGKRRGRHQHRPIAGHRGLRREDVHALGPGDAGQQLQGEQRDAARGHLGCQLGGAQRIARADHHLALAVEFQVGAAGLGAGPGGADLQHDIGGKGVAARRGDLGPLLDILLVGKVGRLAGSGLDQDLEARLDQGGNRRRDQCHAAFARMSLTGNCNNHGSPNPQDNLKAIKGLMLVNCTRGRKAPLVGRGMRSLVALRSLRRSASYR